MKNLKLTKNEIQECQELFEIFSKDAALLDKKLTAMNMDPAAVRNEIGTGIDEFYKFYAGDVDAAAIEGKIKETMMSKSPLEAYSYLANLMTAMAHIGSKVFDDEDFNKCLEDHKNILKAIELGLITEEDPHITHGIEDMMATLAEVHRLSPDFLRFLRLPQGRGFTGSDHCNQFFSSETRHDGVHRGL